MPYTILMGLGNRFRRFPTVLRSSVMQSEAGPCGWLIYVGDRRSHGFSTSDWLDDGRPERV